MSGGHLRPGYMPGGEFDVERGGRLRKMHVNEASFRELGPKNPVIESR